MKKLTTSVSGRLFVLVALGALLGAGAAHADFANFEATLSGAQEVPPVVTPASGTMVLSVNTETMLATWDLEFSDLSTAQTGAHIHSAPAGSNGGVVFGLPLGSPVNGVWQMNLAQYNDLLAGLLYVNVHTESHPGGEIRGQLILRGTVGNEAVTFGLVKALFR